MFASVPQIAVYYIKTNHRLHITAVSGPDFALLKMNRYYAIVPCLIDLSAEKVVENLTIYNCKQIQTIPATIKDKVRVKLLRRHKCNIPSDYIGALLHEKVYSVEFDTLEKIGHSQIEALKHSPNIRTLRLNRLNIEHCHCNYSRSHHIVPTKCETCQGMRAVLENTLKTIHSLVRLELSYNTSIVTDSMLIAVAKNCHRLQELEVAFCEGVTDNSFRSDTKSLGAKEESGDSGIISLHCLRSLNFSGTSITDQALFSFGKLSESRYKLEEIAIDKCSPITDAGIEALLDSCDKLKIVSFADCICVTWKSAEALSEYFDKRKAKCGTTDDISPMKQIAFNVW